MGRGRVWGLEFEECACVCAKNSNEERLRFGQIGRHKRSRVDGLGYTHKANSGHLHSDMLTSQTAVYNWGNSFASARAGQSVQGSRVWGV